MSNLLLRRRMLMQTGGSPTPPTPYDAEVEYIISDGRQLLDTLIHPLYNVNRSLVLTIDCQFTNTTGRQLNGSVDAFYFGVNNGKFEYAYRTYVNNADTNRHTLSKKIYRAQDGVFELDGVTYPISGFRWNSANYVKNNITLCSIWDNGVQYGGCYMYLYGATIEIDGNIVADMNKSVRIGNTGCLYDTVRNIVLTDAMGIGFGCGPDIN